MVADRQEVPAPHAHIFDSWVAGSPRITAATHACTVASCAANAKLAMLLHSQELNTRMKRRGVAQAVNPGPMNNGAASVASF